MAPTQSGGPVNDPTEGLIRRARRSGDQRYVRDQITSQVRLPVSVFEPRLPENRPNAKTHDEYLSVNILSSLASAGLPRDWRGNTKDFYSAQVVAGVCHALFLTVTREPDMGHLDPNNDNPHHGAIHGLVELFYSDRDGYDRAITRLAKAAEILPECLP